MSLSSKFTNSSSKQVMKSYYSCNQGYAPWNPTPYQPHELGYDAYQSYGFGDAYYGYEDPSPPYPRSQKGIEEVIQLLCQERKEIREIKEQIANQVDTLCSIKEGEDALLHEEDDESLRQEGMHECLEEVEEENKYQEAEDVDQEVEHKDKEQKGVESVHFASSEATPPMLPSELHFKWKMDSMELSECNGLLHKLHNNKAKIGWANRVWDLGKSFMDHHFSEITHCMGALRSLNPPGHTNFKHWWGFKDEFKHKPP
ncbi:hypothetical protein PIB30_043541 [Stylosanthes scabra]|uniref:Uncharacterized protein n=1 Tax=Stylosanthes scabra TaxID=79078 RepID=A0ABU6WE39_9FABA|nr:hypothetical protein [Stylosanthes scabra]